MNPTPPLDFGLDGWCSLSRLRARAGWFGTLVDQLWEHEDGLSEMAPLSRPTIDLGIIET